MCALAVRAHGAPSPLLPDAPLPSTDDLDDATRSREGDELGFPGADIVLLPPYPDDALTLDADAAAIAATAPPLREIIAAAHRAAGVAAQSDPIGGWRTRSRWSALMPSISIRVGNSSSWRDVEDPTLLTISRGASFDVRATWRLDDLIYDPNEPRFVQFELALRRERRKVGSIATHLYFRWLRAATASRSDPTATLRAAELAALLDALTAGWFSDRRTPPNH